MNPKAELRRVQRDRIRALSPEDLARQSAQLRERLRRHPKLTAARSIGVYLALPDEPDLRELLQDWLRDGKILVLPYPAGNSHWEFRRIHDLEACREAVWGPLLPDAEEVLEPAALDAILLPGLAFAPDGSRLGRGKGIYDRLLAGYRGHSIGCAFSEQRVETIPREAHDVLLSEMV